MRPLHFDRAQSGLWRPVSLCFLFVLVLLLNFRAAAARHYGLDSRPAIGPFLNNALPDSAPAVSGNWSAVVAFTNLYFTNAVGLTFVPGSRRLCVWEREGRAWTFDNTPGAAEKKLMLDISRECQGWDDSGLLGLAFHPGFATNHYVFVYYTWVKPGTVVGDARTRPEPIRPGAYHDRVSRFTLDNAGVAVPGSEVVFVDQAGNSVWHNGGGMFFHPGNGFLYWTDGDDADSGNTQIINQNLFSGVFRIDVDCRGGSISHPIRRQPANGVTTNYFIPNTNPFVGQPGALEEFFCLGLRNPHRMTCDPPTGRIFIGDVGDSSREEVDVIERGEAGLNFQWSRIEGRQGDLTPPYIGINRGPILDYTHSEGRAVIGGYVYRGKNFAHDLEGKYIFGDNVLRIIWVMDESTVPASKKALCIMPKGSGPNSGTDYTGLSSFGIDADGEIYLCQMSSVGGRIYALSRSGAPPPARSIPPLLSQTGVFKDLRAMQPADGLVPYQVNSPLWSDGAVKERWIALPAQRTIHFAATGEWGFPEGTVFVKTFALPVDDANPRVLRRLETRLIVRDKEGGVYGAGYKWRADLSDADLVSTGLQENISIATRAGTRTQTWFYPGRQDCLSCHTPESGGVLGVKTRQLNGDFTYSATGVTDNQIRTWNHLGMFAEHLDDAAIPRYAKLIPITETHAPLEWRVRSYLDANCAQCHRPGGAHAFFDARFDVPLEKQGLVNGPVENLLGIAGAKVVVPADTAKSILFQRVHTTGESRMPPLGRRVVDENAVDAIAEWIDAMPRARPVLPAPWTHQDIGKIGLIGEASAINGRFNLIASGEDIWEKADAFHFAYCPLNGDGQITARLLSVQQTDPWAKAGVMVRADAGPGAQYVSVLMTPANGAFFQHRPVAGENSRNQAAPAIAAPCWLRLCRAGDVFTGLVSTNGIRWTKVGSISISMSKQVFAGLAVASHNNALLNSTLFDNVQILSGDSGALSVDSPATPLQEQ